MKGETFTFLKTVIVKIKIKDGNPMVKGTYTTTAATIVLTLTHVHGNLIQYAPTVVREGTKVELRYYSVKEMADNFSADLNYFGFVDGKPVPLTLEYSLTGNTLTLTNNGSPRKWIKQ